MVKDSKVFRKDNIKKFLNDRAFKEFEEEKKKGLTNKEAFRNTFKKKLMVKRRK